MDNPVVFSPNSPDFQWHLTNLRNYMNLSPTQKQSQTWGSLELTPLGQGGGSFGLPGDYTPPSRFVRTAFLKTHTPIPAGRDEAALTCFHIMESVSIPKGPVITDRNTPDYTQYTAFINLSSREYFFKTYGSSCITSASLPSNPDAQTGIKSLAALNQPISFLPARLRPGRDLIPGKDIPHPQAWSQSRPSPPQPPRLHPPPLKRVSRHSNDGDGNSVLPLYSADGAAGFQAVHLRHLEIHKNGMIGSGTALHEQFHSLFSRSPALHTLGPLHLQKLSGHLCIQAHYPQPAGYLCAPGSCFPTLQPSASPVLSLFLLPHFGSPGKQLKIEFFPCPAHSKLQFSPISPTNGPADSKSQPVPILNN